jgi:hypothetical protein
MVLQPDWFEVLKPGVGTDRFSYSFNDPMNFSDANGDICLPCGIAAFVAFFSGTNPANAPGPEDRPLPPTGDRAMVDAIVPAAAIATAVRDGDYLGVAMEVLPGPRLIKPRRRPGALIEPEVNPPGRLSSDQLVCREGTCDPDRFTAGATRNADGSLPTGPLRGISVQTLRVRRWRT